MEDTIKFIDLHNSEATPSFKFDAKAEGVKADYKSFLDHVNGLYSRDQAQKKPDLTSGAKVFETIIGVYFSFPVLEIISTYNLGKKFNFCYWDQRYDL